MVTIEWTDEALTWLEEIHAYIAKENRAAASRVVQAIYEKVQALRSFPRMGYVYPNNEGLEVRIVLYGHYRIAYWVQDDTHITVLGVFHGALDIQQYLETPFIKGTS